VFATAFGLRSRSAGRTPRPPPRTVPSLRFGSALGRSAGQGAPPLGTLVSASSALGTSLGSLRPSAFAHGARGEPRDPLLSPSLRFASGRRSDAPRAKGRRPLEPWCRLRARLGRPCVRYGLRPSLTERGENPATPSSHRPFASLRVGARTLRGPRGSAPWNPGVGFERAWDQLGASKPRRHAPRSPKADPAKVGSSDHSGVITKLSK